MNRLLFPPLFLVILLMVMSYNKSIPVPAQENFDVNRYMGTWYEYARLNHPFERGLTQVTATYSLDAKGNVKVLNRGYSEERNKWKEATATAKATKIRGQFKVYFIPLIGGDYKIAYLDSDYSVALVSGGNLKYLWILSRTPKIAPDELTKMLNVAQKLGYDTSQLIYLK